MVSQPSARSSGVNCGEALGSVGAALRFDEDAFRPVAVPSAGSLVDANAACDSERWIGDELARNPFEVIGLEGHIGVDLEPDVGAARQRFDAPASSKDATRAPRAGAADAFSSSSTKGIAARMPRATYSGGFVVTIDDDDPRSRSNGLLGESRREAGEPRRIRVHSRDHRISQ